MTEGDNMQSELERAKKMIAELALKLDETMEKNHNIRKMNNELNENCSKLTVKNHHLEVVSHNLTTENERLKKGLDEKKVDNGDNVVNDADRQYDVEQGLRRGSVSV